MLELEARGATLEAELKISSDTRAQQQQSEPTIGRDAGTPLVSVYIAPLSSLILLHN
jgi:hypothetical protein